MSLSSNSISGDFDGGLSTPQNGGGSLFTSYPSLDLRFSLDRILIDDITFARTGTAMVTGSDGLLGFAPHNFLINSDDLTNASFNRLNIDAITTGHTDPDGGTSAFKVFEDTTNGVHSIHDSMTWLAGERITHSVYAKAAERTVLYTTEGASLTTSAFFNLSTGIVGAVAGSGSPTATMKDAGDGWYRCSVHMTALAGGHNFQFALAQDGSTASYAGTATNGILMWHPSVVRGPVAVDYVDTSGGAAVQGPRFEHGGIYRNLILQSEDLSTTWALARATISTNTVIAPDGTTTADTLVEDATSANTHIVYQIMPDGDFTNDATYTFSCYVKAANRTWVRYTLRDKGGNYPVAEFDVENGVVGGAATAGNTSTIENVGNGWYRCSMSRDIDSGTNDPILHIIAGEATNDVTFDGLSQDSLHLWGAQVELANGRTAASPYIKTTTQTSSNLKTNHIRNNTMVGAVAGTPGTAPTNWSITANGTTVELVGTGTDGSGIEYIDYKFSGTPTADPYLYFETNTGIGALTGEIWTASTYLSYVSGDTTNISGAVISMRERTSSGGNLGDANSSNITLTSTLTRSELTATLDGGSTTANVIPRVFLNWDSSGAIDITLRIGLPQMERESEASPAIRTTDRIQSTGLTSEGLMIEEARTNLALQSQDFSTTWGATRVTIATNSTTAPDGTSTADTIVIDGTDSTTHYPHQAVTIVSGTTYTLSVYAKAKEYTRITPLMETTGFSSNVSATFNLSTGVVDATSGSPDATSITDEGNGWYRCSVTATADASASTPFRFYLDEGTSGAADTAIADGDETSGIYIWQADVTAGAFPTSPIPTTTATVARGAETAAMSDVTWLNDSAGTWLFDYIPSIVGLNAAQRHYLMFFSDTGNDRLCIRSANSGGEKNPHTVIGDGSAVDGVQPATSHVAGVASKYVAAYDGASTSISLDGASVVTASGGYSGASLSTLHIASDSTTNNQLNGTIARITYWPNRLPPPLLTDLTGTNSDNVLQDLINRT